MTSGKRDIARAASELAARVPERLAVLAEVAYDYRWSWTPGGPDVFRAIDPDRWRHCRSNPVRLLQETSAETLARAAADPDLVERAGALAATLRADRERPPGPGPHGPSRPVAFVCAEFGVHRSLPIYSGGLGALAGDILKEAADRALPLVAVGLMYRQGYFHQRININGWQQESWTDIDPERLPMALVTGEDGRPVTVTVPIRRGEVVAQVWRVDVGRVPLFLLDTDRPENPQSARWITARLYVGDPDLRLAQYVLLGVGAIRALEVLGIEPGLVHLNEGHGALAGIELARSEILRGIPLAEALESARRRVVFTTHTPVAAGNDTYLEERAGTSFGAYLDELGIDLDDILALARTRPDDEDEPFGVTQLALRTSRVANGVSRRHGEVAREMWKGLWPGLAAADVPITHVTNGVHLPTWVGPPMRELLDRHLGADWPGRASDPATWAALDQISDEELWDVRGLLRADLVEYVRERSMADRLSRGEPLAYAEKARHAFDPDVLTIGFARRVATYKRLDLLVHEPDHIRSLLTGKRPVQIVLAGKAHPSDEDGKALVQRLFAVKYEPHVSARVVFLDDYELGMAARYVRGCDVWVNLPRPPMEASGTSGMKSGANGGLQLSVLDGWWAEGYDGSNGWALSGEASGDPEEQDARDGAELFRLLEQEIVPAFYERDEDGLPRAWIARVRAALRTVPRAFGAGRMLDDYVERVYGRD